MGVITVPGGLTSPETVLVGTEGDVEQRESAREPAASPRDGWEGQRADDALVDPVTGLRPLRWLERVLEAFPPDRTRGIVIVFRLEGLADLAADVGDVVADAVLAHIGAAVREACGGRALAARAGHAELAIVLPEAGADEGAQLADELRATMEWACGPERRLAVSVVCTPWAPSGAPEGAAFAETPPSSAWLPEVPTWSPTAHLA